MDWEPFLICPRGTEPPPPRKISTKAGLGDRMRTAAFAERQATRAFQWAAEHFQDVPAELLQDWSRQAVDEERHCRIILERMTQLEIDVAERPVSLRLWTSIRASNSGKEFCIFIASAEERGRQAGVRLCTQLAGSDPETEAVFQSIVADEIAHVALAKRYYGWVPPGVSP